MDVHRTETQPIEYWQIADAMKKKEYAEKKK